MDTIGIGELYLIDAPQETYAQTFQSGIADLHTTPAAVDPSHVTPAALASAHGTPAALASAHGTPAALASAHGISAAIQDTHGTSASLLNSDLPSHQIWFQETYTPTTAVDLAVGPSETTLIDTTFDTESDCTEMAVLQIYLHCTGGDGKAVIEINAAGYQTCVFVWLHDTSNANPVFTFAIPENLSGQALIIHGWVIEKNPIYGCYVQLIGNCQQYKKHAHGFSSQPSGHPVSTQPASHSVDTQPASHAVDTQPADHSVSAQPSGHSVDTQPAEHPPA